MSTDEEVTNSDTEQSKSKIDWDDLDAKKQHQLVALAETLGSDDPVSEAKEATRGAKVGRRTFLGAGATVGAGLLGTLFGTAQADSNQAGTYGTSSNPGDFYGEDMFLVQQTDLSTPPAGYINLGSEGTTPKYKLPNGSEYAFGGVDGDNIEPASVKVDPVTMYVRSGGSDSNDGLSSGNAKATIQDAIDEAPVQNYSQYVVVDIQESGATFTESVTVDKYHPPVKILGPTDGSGNPDVTLSASGTGTNWFNAFGSHVFFENVKVGAAPMEGRIIENSTVDFKNCTGPSSFSGTNFISVSSNSYVQVWPSTEFDIDGMGGDRCIAMANGFSLIQGTLRGGTQWVFAAEENSGFIVMNGAVIDAGTDGGVPLHSRESSFGKTSADHQNASVGVEAAHFGGVDITSSASFTGTSTRKQVIGTGYIDDDADTSPTFQTHGKEIPGIPTTSSSASPGFDTWAQASADRPAQVTVSAVAVTDGSTVGRVRLSVDDSGGTTADYTIPVADAPPDNGSGTGYRGGLSMVIPPGAQYQIENTSDPNASNQIFTVREHIL